MAEAKRPAFPAKTDAAAKTDPAPVKAEVKKDGTRETVEAIVVAFVFAFLFRTFEAEAFVIPTGSMAPTLLGRHKDAVCPECRFEFPVGASEELDRGTSTLLERRLLSAVCPNCRFRINVRDDPVFAGDRILVTKFNREFFDPDRWDVTVFKYPEDHTTNYIKRLCGLPGETLEIRQGDLYGVSPDGRVEILRKRHAAKQRAILQTVYDDLHPCETLLEKGWPERWAGVARDDAAGGVAGWSEAKEGWTADPQARTYSVAAADEPRWLRYRHFAPTRDVWTDLERRGTVGDPEARLVLDFCGYNGITFEGQFSQVDEGTYWVGDLAVSARVEIADAKPGAELLLELVEGGRRYRCTIDPAAGKATLGYVDALDREQRDGAAHVLSEAQVGVSGAGTYDVVFANVDDRLWLWVDGSAIEFPEADYTAFGGQLIQRPTADDLSPVGVSAKGMTATVSRLLVQRDVYYRGDSTDGPPAAGEWPTREAGSEQMEYRLNALAGRPDAYADAYRENTPRLAEPLRFALAADEYLMLGDNSPKSQDSRLWSNTRGDVHRHAVPANAIVGKALLIFWPHGLRWGNENKNGIAQGWTIPKLDRFFYHRDVNNRVVADYPVHGLPFYPDFGRLFRRVR